MFSGAGLGPVPASALVPVAADHDAAWLVGSLDARGDIALSKGLCPKEWNDCARRAIYAYDWSGSENRYELQAVPREPIQIEKLLSTPAGRIARRTRLLTSFADTPNIDPAAVRAQSEPVDQPVVD
jgi:hypothetical protein